jgi:type IV secretory pathway TraG/TraD family ATPase VirD4
MSIFLFGAWLAAILWLARHRGAELTSQKILWSLIIGGVTLGVAMAVNALGFRLFSFLIPTTFLIWVWFIFTAGIADQDHLRGGTLVDANTLKKLARKEDPKAEIFIGGVGIPGRLEARHFLLAGTTGAGKSQAFYQIAEVARQRGDAAVIADVNAEMLGRFFDPGRGDSILNPVDSRSESWSPLAEIFAEWDCERIAQSIVPSGEGEEGEWKRYAQVLLAAILSKVWRERGKNFDLSNLILFAPSEELGETLKGTQASLLFAAGAEKMLGSIRSILATHCQPFSYLDPSAGRDAFSITKFIQREAAEKRGAWLYFPVRDDFFKAFSPLVAGQIDIAISALLSSDDNEARRVFFILDEFASWGRMGSIGDLLTKARKKGGVGVLGLQTISQVRQSYGRDGAQTLLANLGTWLTLRPGDHETAEFMSLNIGDEQVRRFVESSNHERQKSVSEQIAVERAIMPADLKNLPDLDGILNIAGALPAGWIQVPISPLKRTVPGFELVRQQIETGIPVATESPSSDSSDLIGELLEDGIATASEGGQATSTRKAPP